MCGRSLRAHGRAAAVRMRLLCRPQLNARGRCHAEHAPVHSKRNGCAPNAAGPAALCFVQGTCPRVVAQARVSDIGVLCSLLAAAAHDYAHPARTNAFLVSTKVRFDRTRATGDCGNSALPLVCAIAVHGSARRLSVGQRALRALHRHRWQYGITTSLCWNRCTRPSCSRSCKTPTVTFSPRCPRTSSG